jgi:hypothetical protein
MLRPDEARRIETLLLEDAAIIAAKKFGLRTDADLYRLKLVVDQFYAQQLAIEEAQRELERENFE